MGRSFRAKKIAAQNKNNKKNNLKNGLYLLTNEVRVKFNKFLLYKFIY